LSSARARALLSARRPAVPGAVASARACSSATNLRTRAAFWPKSNLP
jgi:hypothetical protein